MSFIIALMKALAAGLSVFKSEREIHNRPDMVKAKTAEAIQEAKDRLSLAEKILADPKASAADHAEALRAVQLAHS